MRPRIAPARPVPSHRAIGPSVAAILAGLVFLALAVGPLSALFESRSLVARITFVNPTEYDLSIDATNAERDGWVPVGTARKDSTTIHEQIIDQGDVWIFRFDGQGEDAGELRMTRAELKDTKWTVRIPRRIGEELRAKGAPPTP